MKFCGFRDVSTLAPGSTHELHIWLMNVHFEGSATCLTEHGEAGERVRETPDTSF